MANDIKMRVFCISTVKISFYLFLNRKPFAEVPFKHNALPYFVKLSV
jgi:hypothetical protein